MGDNIRFQLMDKFAIFINDRQESQAFANSRKASILIEYLILNRGQPIPNQKLLAILWPDENSSNPAISLKTLISRTRASLNKISEGLGNSIVADRGAYHWEVVPGASVDVYLIEDIFAELEHCSGDREKYGHYAEQLLELYRGDLLQVGDAEEWVTPRSVDLHNKFLAAMEGYLQLLKANKEWDDVIRVCRQTLDIDNFSEQMHIHLMNALIETNRSNEALMQYKYATHLQYRYLGIQPSEDMQEFYKQIVNAGRTLEFNMEAIQNELIESENHAGAFVCEYSVFKEIFNLQIRNLERLQTTMFLAVIMVSDINGQPFESIKQSTIMNNLLEIMKSKLRKGDAITHYSPSMLALLLPTVNYKTAGMVLERIKKLFYATYPCSEVRFDYRVGPLKSSVQMRSAGLKSGEAEVQTEMK